LESSTKSARASDTTVRGRQISVARPPCDAVLRNTWKTTKRTDKAAGAAREPTSSRGDEARDDCEVDAQFSCPCGPRGRRRRRVGAGGADPETERPRRARAQARRSYRAAERAAGRARLRAGRARQQDA